MNQPSTEIRFARTPVLDIAYEQHGSEDGKPIILLHGFPYDARCYDEVAAPLAATGHRVIVPYLRGYGLTRFLSDDIMRSGQQAALAQDLLDLMDALSIQRAALAGYDWGGRAACIAAALWPERVRCLVTGDGYNLQDIPGSVTPKDPQEEYTLWYQYYFNTRRGRDGLAENRFEFCKLLWTLWSPTWRFTDDTFAATARSFDNPDFVEVVIHSYRHRYGYVAGDAAYEETERRLTRQPSIGVPTISLCGADSGFGPPSKHDEDAAHFSGRYERRILPGVGHDIPQEAPQAVVQALIDLLGQAE